MVILGRLKPLNFGLSVVKVEMAPIDPLSEIVEGMSREIDRMIIDEIRKFAMEQEERDRRNEEIKRLLEEIADGKISLPPLEQPKIPWVQPFNPYVPAAPWTQPYTPQPMEPYVGDPLPDWNQPWHTGDLPVPWSITYCNSDNTNYHTGRSALGGIGIAGNKAIKGELKSVCAG